jgi:ABC-type proline/glycine betaine transport system ATPase subunit
MNENATNDEELMKVMGLNAGMVEGIRKFPWNRLGFDTRRIGVGRTLGALGIELTRI